MARFAGAIHRHAAKAIDRHAAGAIHRHAAKAIDRHAAGGDPSRYKRMPGKIP